MKTRNRSPREIGLYIFILIIILSAFYLMYSPGDTGVTSVEYSELRRLFMSEDVV